MLMKEAQQLLVEVEDMKTETHKRNSIEESQRVVISEFGQLPIYSQITRTKHRFGEKHFGADAAADD
jgi:hypothetical protein